LFIGGGGGRRSIALAACYADEYNTEFTTLDGVRARVDRVAAACQREGREPIGFSLMADVVVGTDATDLERRIVRASSISGVDVAELRSAPPPFWIVGTIDGVVEQLVALRDCGVTRMMCRHILHDDLDTVGLIGDELAPRLARA
jgi:alkanesulfonate monooxygenase SsuD/methylene tetrahydromethanopterin reductase-like flavin-dependent oxidoreductase (luciferase family)